MLASFTISFSIFKVRISLCGSKQATTTLSAFWVPGNRNLKISIIRIIVLGVFVLTTDDEILAELKKIREAVEKAPPPQPPKGLWNEFLDFLSKV